MSTRFTSTTATGMAWLVLPPVLPLIAALVMAEAVPGIGQGPADLGDVFLPAAQLHLVHLGDLLTYGAVGFLHIALCLTAIVVFAAWTLRFADAQRRPALRALSLEAMLVIGLVVIAHVFADDLALIRVTFKSICELMVQADLGTGIVDRCYGTGNESALTALSWVPTFAGMATVVVAVGLAGGLAAPFDEPTEESGEARWRADFKRRGPILQNALYLLSAVLVTSTLAVVLFASLPVELVADKASKAAVASYAQGLGAFWGMVFTLTLTAAILPSALILQRAAQRHGAVMEGTSDLRDWLGENIFGSARKQLGNAALLLAPLIAGPAGGMLAKSFG